MALWTAAVAVPVIAAEVGIIGWYTGGGVVPPKGGLAFVTAVFGLGIWVFGILIGAIVGPLIVGTAAWLGEHLRRLHLEREPDVR